MNFEVSQISRAALSYIISTSTTGTSELRLRVFLRDPSFAVSVDPPPRSPALIVRSPQPLFCLPSDRVLFWDEHPVRILIQPLGT